MTIPNDFWRLRGDRAAMLAAYDITPIRRFQCLPTRPVRGLYQLCTEEAYQFAAKRKEASGPLFTFYTGHWVGRELLGRLRKTLPPLETWRMDEDRRGSALGDCTTAGAPGSVAPAVHSFNAQLLRLLNLFFLRHTLDPTKPSGVFFSEINTNPDVPQYRIAVALNTVLVRHQETSTDLVAWLMTQVGGARVRPYNFTMLHEHLATLVTPPAVIAICRPM